MFKAILVETLLVATIWCVLGSKDMAAVSEPAVGTIISGNNSTTAAPGGETDDEDLNTNSTTAGKEEIRGRFLGGGPNGILAGGFGDLGPGGLFPGSPLGGNGLGVFGGGLGATGLGPTGPGGFGGDDGQFGAGRFGGIFSPVIGGGGQSNPDFLVEEVTFTCRAYAIPGIGRAPVIQWSVDTRRGQPFPIAIGPQIYGNQRGVNVDYRPEVPGIWVSRLTFSKPTIYADPFSPSKTYICSTLVPGRQPVIIGYASVTSSPSSAGGLGGQGLYAGGLSGGPFGGIGGGYGSPYDFRSAGGANTATGGNGFASGSTAGNGGG